MMRAQRERTRPGSERARMSSIRACAKRTWRNLGCVVVVAATALPLAACSGSGNPGAVHAWRVHDGCPSPAAVARASNMDSLMFEYTAPREKSATTSGCTYVARHASVSIEAERGGPSNVDYNTAAGIRDTNMPTWGAGAHTGTSRNFCGAAVPTTSGNTLEVTITTRDRTIADCAALAPLVRLSATRP